MQLPRARWRAPLRVQLRRGAAERSETSTATKVAALMRNTQPGADRGDEHPGDRRARSSARR